MKRDSEQVIDRDLFFECGEAVSKSELAIEQIEALRKGFEKLDLLYAVGKRVGMESELSKLLDEIMEMAQRTVKAEASSVLLIDKESGKLLFEIAKGRVGNKAKHLTLSVQSGIAGWVANHYQPLIVNDVTKDERFNKAIDECTGFKTRSIICVPLMVGGNIVGVLEVLNKLDESEFNNEDLKLLTALASTAALAIHNAKLHQAVLGGYMNTIRVLAATIDAKDPYTYGHSQRVTEYALMAAVSLSLSSEEKQAIEYGGILHDVGKIAVSESILCKPASLTADEWRVIRAHPSAGAAIIESVPFLEKPRNLILHHHERFNGAGYPDGLVNESIPVGARLLAVADAFDTMTTSRAYRPALSVEHAVNELRRCAGAQFCPVAVEAFIDSFEKQGNVLVNPDRQFCNSELLAQLLAPPR